MEDKMKNVYEFNLEKDSSIFNEGNFPSIEMDYDNDN